MDANAHTSTLVPQDAAPRDSNNSFVPGYHLRPITKGVFGEPSKIVEEVEEFQEALEQGNDLMALIELSDLVGAVEGWLSRYHPTITLDTLRTMSNATQRAFRNGHR